MQAAALVGALALPSIAVAAENDTILELRPHCDATDNELENVFGGPIGADIPGITTPTDGSICPMFAVADPLHRQTDILKIGDVLDMDLVIVNPQENPISRVRGWFGYDPTLLEGMSVELSPSFSLPVPGEADFDTENGLVKIGASTPTPLSSKLIKVARIKMKILAVTSNSTVLSFDDVSGIKDSHSAVITKSGTDETNVLPNTLGSLIVRLDAPKASSAASNASEGFMSSVASDPLNGGAQSSAAENGSNQSNTSSSSVAATTSQQSTSATVFTLLQIQNLRVTTEGNTAYLAWDPLNSSELQSYNVYYGETSGKYLHRRNIDKASTTLTIRGLMENTTYYFAVRGVNKNGQETQFSKEVSVLIGHPETSTAPLSASALNQGPRGKAPATGGAISGETGSSSSMLIFFGVCAVIGTLLALRRQFSASAHV